MKGRGYPLKCVEMAFNFTLRIRCAKVIYVRKKGGKMQKLIEFASQHGTTAALALGIILEALFHFDKRLDQRKKRKAKLRKKLHELEQGK